MQTKLILITKFQSTHPCGVRRVIRPRTTTQESFNPRTRVGCDAKSVYIVKILSVSIHAPVWGATKSTTRTQTGERFQSTHPCGVRLLWGILMAQGLVSIHAPVWGATEQHIPTNVQCYQVSIHAPVWGATTLCKYILPLIFCFNPRTRVGCDQLI